MDTLKKTLVYCDKLRNNEIDHGDIFANRLIPIMRKFALWWTDEDYKITPKWLKVLYVVLIVRLTTFLLFSLAYLAMNWDSKPIAMIFQDGAILTTGLVESSAAFIFPFFRKRTTKLLRTINELNLDILKRNHNALVNRRTSNRLFLAIFFFCGISFVAGSMNIVIFIWEFVNTGLPQFNSFFYQPTPYSIMAFLDAILLWIPAFWIMSLVTFYISMFIEFILRISFYFHVTAEEMRQLRRSENVDEEKEHEKLKSLIKDLNLLYWCVNEYNGTLRIYMILFFLLAFTTFGIFAAVILSMGSIMKSWKILSLPFYLLFSLISFCVIGQHLKDSADEVRVGIYDCDWYSAPIAFRKLVLNVLTRGTRETLFQANPFYNIDLRLLTRVMKTTYTLITLFRKFLK